MSVIQDLVHEIEAGLRGSGPATAVVEAALRQFAGDAAVVRSARFSEAAYVRVPLARTDAFEVRLLCWRPGQSSGLHHHGESACAFRVVSGVASEVRLDGAHSERRAGEVALAEPGVHQVANLGSGPLVTLHVYAPPLPVDQPASAEGRSIVVLGGGFCGVALAIQLLRTDDPTLRITVVDPAERLGRGVAYATGREEHGLNVPSAAMSLDPAAPDDFWFHAGGDRTGFAPRRLYAEYLERRLSEALSTSRAKLRWARATAAGVTPDGGRFTVRLSDGRELTADDVVLATGHGPPVVPRALEPLASDPAVVTDPWRPAALDFSPESRVCAVGTGLTAVDVVHTLRARGHGTIHVVSRHGRWPRPHLPNVRHPVAWTLSSAPPATASALARWVEDECALAAERSFPWQAVIDAVRPQVGAIWSALPDAERAAFLERHRGGWEVVRHRVAHPSWLRLRAWSDAGALVTHAGGIVDAHRDADAIAVTLGDGTAHRVDRVVVCAGWASDPRRFDGPLWTELLASGLVVADPHGLGVHTDDRGATLGADGEPTGLWALGGLLRPRWFESSAVPELSRQVAALTRALSRTAAPPVTRADRPGPSV